LLEWTDTFSKPANISNIIKLTKLLSDQEIQFFKEKGYLIKKQIMAPNLVSLARERFWDHASDKLDPKDPNT